MKIDNVKLSGFKGIPFCANFSEENSQVTWEDLIFQVTFPQNSPFLSAVIGPNSCGKSSILYALQYFFSSTTKLSDECFYFLKNTLRPIIMELTFWGKITEPQEWHQNNCKVEGDTYYLSLLSVTNIEKRLTFIRIPDGSLRKPNKVDNDQLDKLLPKFRLFPADSKLTDEVNPEKKNLAAELIEDIISTAPNSSNRSIQYKIQKSLHELEQLVTREENNSVSAWKDLEKLESSISSSLIELGSGKPQVRFNINENIPSLQTIFSKGKFKVIDGVELGLEGQGLGIQRTFLMSVLNTWANIIGHRKSNQDYIFAVEEPEVFLHPHAIRYLLNILVGISKRDQVIFTSHVSEFVNSVPIDNVIKVCRNGNSRYVIQPNLDQLPQKDKTKVQRYLLEDKSDMLFARAVLLVEGQSELFALPRFAEKLNFDINKKGCSIVFTGSFSNFPVYHQILQAFRIPHIILSDGDGNRQSAVDRLNGLADEIFVLEEDFEYLIADTLTEDRILKIVNHCRKLQGQKPLANLENTGINAEQLKSDWWKKLTDEINADIVPEYRSRINQQKRKIERILIQIAQTTIENNYLLPTVQTKKRAKIIKLQTKPLAGRVIGEIVTTEEIMNMAEIYPAISRLIEIAG